MIVRNLLIGEVIQHATVLVHLFAFARYGTKACALLRYIGSLWTFKDKKILVVGLARTGVALCRFLVEHGRPGDGHRSGAA